MRTRAGASTEHAGMDKGQSPLSYTLHQTVNQPWPVFLLIALLLVLYNSVYMFRMSSYDELDPYESYVCRQPPIVSELFEEYIRQNHSRVDAENETKAEEMVRKHAAWRLRSSVRETRMFRLRRGGELAMSATIAPLGVYGVVESLSEGRIGCVATSIIAIVWSLGVAHEAVRDLNSTEYTNLINNTAHERMHYDATMASLTVNPECTVG